MFVIQRNPQNWQEALHTARFANESSTFYHNSTVRYRRTHSEKLSKKLEVPNRVRAAAGLNESFTCPRETNNVNIFMTGINLINNYIHIKVGHVHQYALIDSGSDINVINKQIIKTVNCRQYRSDKTRITAVNNEQMSISSVVYIPITIGNHIFSIKFYVVKSIKPDIILGLEFLQSNNIVIEFNDNKMRVDPRRQLILSKDTVIPPMSEKVVVAKIRGSSLPDEIMV
ncbi:unnamed protein product [Mytilus coruscus]|uniref:Aspartic peptidase DDI1-type domain-containing protein n=1 Tax=Mytilus coruscus TaxID=42192 RepID=A0A6J8A1R0_MYTCO|nr:unnamed protein product [Mytilus coruscus]